MPTISLSELKANSQKQIADMENTLKQYGIIRLPNGNYTKVESETDQAKDTQSLLDSTLLSPAEAAGFDVPYGTPKTDVYGKEYIAPAIRNKINETKLQWNQIDTLINQIDRLSKKVNTGGNIVSQLPEWIGAATRANTNARLLSNKKGALAVLIRQVMQEKGALANQDIDRAINLIPQPIDTRELAEGNLSELREFIKSGRPVAEKNYYNNLVGGDNSGWQILGRE